MNEYIKKRSDKFVQNYILRQISAGEEVIQEAKSELYSINDNLDKVTFLKIVLETNAEEYRKHLFKCKNKKNCPINYNHETVEYFLTQELNNLGIRTNNDQFSPAEKEDTESKLNKILEDLQTLKHGQQIIYDDLKAEFDNLRDLYILGKKNWTQLLLGKMTEMVASGIISETISKDILSIVGKEVNKLLH